MGCGVSNVQKGVKWHMKVVGRSRVSWLTFSVSLMMKTKSQFLTAAPPVLRFYLTIVWANETAPVLI